MLCYAMWKGVIHVFVHEEYGRQLQRRLIYASDVRLTLHAPPKSVAPCRFSSLGSALECGDPAGSACVGESVVIKRLHDDSAGEKVGQTFVPRRHLTGVLPDALLEVFTFWQNDDFSLTGYPQAGPAAGVAVDTGTVSTGDADAEGDGVGPAVGTLLEVRPQGESGGASVRRLAAEASLRLLPLLGAPQGSALQRLRDLLLRMEDLSHTLVWGSDDAGGADAPVASRVELPRLGLSFTARRSAVLDATQSAGAWRLYSDEHPALFVSDLRTVALSRLLRGLPHALLLQDDYGALHVLLPATAKPFLVRSSGAGGTDRLALHRGDHEWRANLPVGHHIASVNPSCAFLSPSTLAAALHLLLMRLLHRQHAEAADLAGACAHDGELSKEERQLFDTLELTNVDSHPDAHAVRRRDSNLQTRNLLDHAPPPLPVQPGC